MAKREIFLRDVPKGKALKDSTSPLPMCHSCTVASESPRGPVDFEIATNKPEW